MNTNTFLSIEPKRSKDFCKDDKVGIFFGSFNPPHIGHHSIIETAINVGKFDKVIVVPAYQNPWKNKEENYPTYEQRLNLCKKTFEDLGGYVYVSDIEGTMHWQSGDDVIYTYQTLSELRSELKNFDLNIICTFETICEMPRWVRGLEILKTFNFYIVDTYNTDIVANFLDIVIDLKKQGISINYTVMKPSVQYLVSSTIVRNEFIKYYNSNYKYIIGNYINNEVYKEIVKNKFYKLPNGTR